MKFLLKYKWLFLFFLLVVSLFSYKVIPFYSAFPDYSFGYDFWNLYKFQNCIHANNPYIVPPGSCGDERGMVYPPAIFWTYQWVKGLSFPTALWIWLSFVLLSLVASSLYWLERPRQRFWIFIPLVIFQYPGFYTFERGNNDIYPVLLWSICSFFYLRGWVFQAGLLAGLAVAMKIYPVIAVSVFVLGGVFYFLKNRKKPWSGQILLRQDWLRFGLGCVLMFLVVFAITWEQSLPYFFKILPKWSTQEHGRHVSIHSFWSIQGHPRWITLVLIFLLVKKWKNFLIHLYKEDIVFLFALSLGVSTYIQKISNDYNLITLYPLFFLMLSRLLSKEMKGHDREKGYFIATVGCLVSALGCKWLWKNVLWDVGGFQIVLQYLWFYFLPGWVYKSNSKR